MEADRPTTPGLSLFGKPVIKRSVTIPPLSPVVPDNRRIKAPPDLLTFAATPQGPSVIPVPLSPEGPLKLPPQCETLPEAPSSGIKPEQVPSSDVETEATPDAGQMSDASTRGRHVGDPSDSTSDADPGGGAGPPGGPPGDAIRAAVGEPTSPVLTPDDISALMSDALARSKTDSDSDETLPHSHEVTLAVITHDDHVQPPASAPSVPRTSPAKQQQEEEEEEEEEINNLEEEDEPEVTSHKYTSEETTSLISVSTPASPEPGAELPDFSQTPDSPKQGDHKYVSEETTSLIAIIPSELSKALGDTSTDGQESNDGMSEILTSKPEPSSDGQTSEDDKGIAACLEEPNKKVDYLSEQITSLDLLESADKPLRSEPMEVYYDAEDDASDSTELQVETQVLAKQAPKEEVQEDILKSPYTTSETSEETQSGKFACEETTSLIAVSPAETFHETEDFASAPEPTQDIAYAPKPTQYTASTPKPTQVIASTPKPTQVIASTPEPSAGKLHQLTADVIKPTADVQEDKVPECSPLKDTETIASKSCASSIPESASTHEEDPFKISTPTKTFEITDVFHAENVSASANQQEKDNIEPERMDESSITSVELRTPLGKSESATKEGSGCGIQEPVKAISRPSIPTDSESKQVTPRNQEPSLSSLQKHEKPTQDHVPILTDVKQTRGYDSKGATTPQSFERKLATEAAVTETKPKSILKKPTESKDIKDGTYHQEPSPIDGHEAKRAAPGTAQHVPTPGQTNLETIHPEPRTTSVKPAQPAAKTTSVKPEQPTVGPTSVQPQQPTARTTSVKPQQPTARTTSVKPQQPTARPTALKSEQPTARTSLKSEQPTARTTSLKSEQQTSTTASKKTEQETAKTAAIKPLQRARKVSTTMDKGPETQAVSSAIRPQTAKVVESKQGQTSTARSASGTTDSAAKKLSQAPTPSRQSSEVDWSKFLKKTPEPGGKVLGGSKGETSATKGPQRITGRGNGPYGMAQTTAPTAKPAATPWRPYGASRTPDKPGTSTFGAPGLKSGKMTSSQDHSAHASDEYDPERTPPVLRVRKFDAKSALMALKSMPEPPDSPKAERSQKQRPKSGDASDLPFMRGERSHKTRDRPRSEAIYEGLVSANKDKPSVSRSFSMFDRNFKSNSSEEFNEGRTATLPRKYGRPQNTAAPSRRPVSWGGQDLGRDVSDHGKPNIPSVSSLRDRFQSPSSDSLHSSRSSSRESSVSSLRDRFMSPPPEEPMKSRPRVRVLSPPPPRDSRENSATATLRERFMSPPKEPLPKQGVSKEPSKIANIRNRFMSPPPPKEEKKLGKSKTASLRERLFSPTREPGPSTSTKLRERFFSPTRESQASTSASTASAARGRDLPDVVSDEMSPDVEEDDFNEGLILPPLLLQLKKILDQYPDDSQILKELIQNAEDAGAKSVKFLYDRHCYGQNPRFLHHPGLARFQGPALYAHNDALFDDNDWKGIRMLSQSVKQTDPFKVGYFGLGFKSIFHITDMPSVLSGARLGMIDPHQRCFPVATHSWNLAKKQDLVTKFPDQFAPFLRVFDCSKDTFTEGFYNGTLFRFPLRTQPSPLSDSLYDKDKVHRLFRSFQSEAHLTLLFLKYLESIELYERDELSLRPRLVFKVRIAEECLEEVTQRRSEFLNKAKSGNWLDKPLTSTFPITVETVLVEGSKEHTTTYRWLVTNFYSGGQVSAIFRKLHRDSELSYPPWVGVAMPTNIEANNANSDADVYELNDSDGQVFCFLPLPSENQTPTGLPVHINGFFALEQNRKYLKWPNSSQKREELMDKRLLWNQCLLKEAIPNAYVELLLQAIDLQRSGSNVPISIKTIYRAVPDFDKIDRKWEVILIPMFSELFKHAMVHTAARGGEWLEPRDAIFNTLEEDQATCDVILRVLSESEARVADVPPHVLHAIRTCCHINLGKITPNLVSSAFKTTQNDCSVSGQERLLLLRYLLKSRKYELIDGLELLPLANGGFHTFYTNPRRADRVIYMATADQPQVLLPGMEDNFLESDIDEDLLKSLAKAAYKGYTQLKLLTKDLVIELLEKSLPKEWLSGVPVTWTPGEVGHPPAGWLELLWVYLQRHFRKDLSVFENLAVMPVATSEQGQELVPLYAISGIIVQHLDGLSLDDRMESILIRLGVIVIEELPDYVKSHPVVLEQYVNTPSYVGVLKTFHRIVEHVGVEKFLEVFMSVTDADDKRHLRELFSRMSPFHLRPEHRPLLCKLPLFETLDGCEGKESHFVSSEEVSLAAPATVLPINLSKPLVDISQTDSQNLAQLLGIRRMTVIELLRVIVFPDIESAYYEPGDIETIMLYVLRHFYSYIEMDETFIETLRTLPFLPRRDMFVTPERLYDPAQQLLKTLFLGEVNFPTGPYAEPSIIAILRQIGLKGPQDVEPEDLLETARQIEDAIETDDSSVKETAVVKSGALLSYLTHHMTKLYEKAEDQELHEHLAGIRWVRPMTAKPAFYPNKLHWCEGDASFVKPSEMRSMVYASCLGSVAPVVASGTNDEFGQMFGWDTPPTIPQMTMHIANMVSAYDPSDKAKYMELSSRIYAQLEKHTAEEILYIFKENNLHEWVWHGDGFTKADHVVFEEPFMDLRPFVYSIPSEMTQFGELFGPCGVRAHCQLPEVLKMVKEKYENNNGQPTADVDLKRDLHICVSILNEIKGSITSDEQLLQLQEELMLPIHDEKRPNVLRMAALQDCTYCDQEWMRAGYDLRDLLDEEEEEMLFVHPNVPNSTSEVLGVPTLMSRMLDAEELDFSFGQTDSLTHRLNVLLQDYTDGFAVPKELVQNADDAGATEVKFLYDERENEDAQTCLIDESMKECQGPALWVYNDAVFTDLDFENITKLSGATKESQTEKIGTFGLGFNAVYNLTDVPCFISRHNIVIFDPHTTHLGKSIRNKAKPGIKIDMRKHKRKLRRLGNQFKPYNNIFGCDLRPDSYQESFDATLFRFPLRTKSQAIVSEICQKHYDRKEMRTLLQMLIKGAESLLLFTQNVIKISVYHLPPTASENTVPKPVFTVSKEPLKILRELRFNSDLSVAAMKQPPKTQEFIRQCSVLRACTETMLKIKQGRMKKDSSTPTASMVLQVDCVLTHHGSTLLSVPTQHLSKPWMVCSCMGTGDSLRMACVEENLLPSAGIAVPLLLDDQTNNYIPQAICHPSEPDRHFGTVFTYLPLPIRTGLPVHINGSFAVTSNRRYLCERNEDDKFDVRAIWNECLISDAVCDTYLQLLEDLATISSPGAYPFTLLWPQMARVESNTKTLVNSFYQLVAQVNDEMPSFFTDGSRWVSLQDAVFLEPGIHQSEIGPVAMEIFADCLIGSTKTVIDLPDFVLQGFKMAKSEANILERSFGLRRFLEEILLPNLLNISAERRDPVILYALRQNDDRINKLLIEASCIPVSPDGQMLRSPEELVDPSGDLASMYLPQDGRFPYGVETYGSKEILSLLENLGMASNDMLWEDVVERARSLDELDSPAARRRVQNLVHFMQKKLERNLDEDVGLYRDQLQETVFLPVMKRPKTITMQWKGDDFSDDHLLSPRELYGSEKLALVCCIEPIVDDGMFPKSSDDVKKFLGFEEKVPSLHDVLLQLDTIISSDFSNESAEVVDEVQRISSAIYEYLRDFMLDPDQKDEVTVVVDRLKDLPFIFCNGVFLKPRQIAFSFHYHCAPYLYGLPDAIKRNFVELFTRVGVRETFESKDFVETLQTMHATHGNRQLDKESLKLALRLVNLLNDTLSEAHLPLAEVVELYGAIYIPDANGVLYDAVDLCYNEPECQWLPQDEDILLSHPLIPYAISKQLGVNTRREEMLRKHSKGIPFGQREKLTNRIKRILSSYPCDKEILKELLQNADDAGATEIHFVSDSRHHSKERVFDDSWKPLQGPALCVYNNSPFTEIDLQGIQRLGEGSKSADPNKTGQYGVGFNCVYHLTDVPSFLSCSPNIGETLCIFDPHATYVPGATLEEPGRRYEDVQELRNIFTDVFPCYLEDKFDLNNATMFRFPLRTEAMAQTSELSEQVMTSEKVEALLVKFKRELFDCLLFVNSVKTISVSDVDKLTNRLTKTYTVTVDITDEDQHARTAFARFLREMTQKVRNGEIGVWEVPPRELSYIIRISDNKGYWERWLITQRIGFPDGTKISVALYEALKRGDLALLPRGGVSALLENSDPQTPFRPMKAFCFLPLPLKTSLPLHINGHFALDHEARRNLWIDDENSPKTEWNMTMLRHIIARAYVSMLRKAPSFLLASTMEAPEASFVSENNSNIPNLEFYSSLFPKFKTNEVYWKTVVEAVYQIIDQSQEKVLPVLRRRGHIPFDLSNEDLMQDHPESEVDWVSTSGDGGMRPYFDNLDESFLDEVDGTTGIMTPRNRLKSTPKKKTRRDYLRRVLLASGYQLLHLPLDVYETFRTAGIMVECITPASVIQFYRSYGTVNQVCKIGVLPTSVSNTPFRNVKTLRTMLQYCIQDRETFFTCLEGLPFLLSEDEQLRVFSNDDSPFLTEFYDLLPDCSFMFLHHKLMESTFVDFDPEDHHVFQRFDIPALASLLINVLDERVYRNGREQIPWVLNGESLPNPRWIKMLWSFIKSECVRLTKDKDLDDTEMREQVNVFLKPLRNWCILPAEVPTPKRHGSSKVYYDTADDDSESAELYLVPVGLAETIIDFSQSSIMSYTVRDSLRKLGLPELNNHLLDGTSWSPMPKKNGNNRSINGSQTENGSIGVSEVARLLVATLEKPQGVLSVLDYQIRNKDTHGLLKQEECNYILKYFNECVGEWLEEKSTIKALRGLPFYLTVHGDLISLNEHVVYALPNDIPTADMHVWEKESGIIFLRSNKNLMRLHEKLGCLSLTITEVYTKFIFRNFQLLAPEARITHLQFLKDGRLQQMEKAEKELLLVGMRHLEFLEDESGVLHRACHFYDPYHSVFKVMLAETPSSFPPPPFNEFKWLDFLRLIGLQHTVGVDMFLDFASQIAKDAMVCPSDKTLNKSRTLLDHLFKRKNLPSEGLLHKVADTPFIPPGKINPMLQRIYPQYGYRNDGKLSYISFRDSIPENHEYLVWTSGHLLPSWANPYKLNQIDVSFQYPEDHLLHDFENYRMEIAKLLGVEQAPPTWKVAEHVSNICNNTFNLHASDELRAFMKVDVMKVVYKYLQSKEAEMTEEVRTILKDSPCIIVDLGYTMMKPFQVVINMMEEDQIHPYLYKVPTELGEFKSLFLSLGASLNATVDQFAVVLNNIFKETKGAKLHPNELRAAFKAVHGLFHTLERHPTDPIESLMLYLPSMSGTLVPAKELVYNDDPSYTDRIKDFDRPFIIDLSECGLSAIDYDDLIKLLPPRLQPAMLTSIVQEILEDSSRETIVSYGIAERLKHQLNSKAFSLGISRLVRHEHHRSGHKVHQETLDAIQNHLKKIRVFGVEKVVTFLMYKKRRIQGSEIESECFVDKTDETDEQDQRWNVYVDNSATLSEELLVCVAEVVNRIIGGLLRNSVHYLQPILSCPPHAVSKVLDRLKIRPDHSVDIRQPVLPTPGSFIPIDDHHLLKEDFEEYEVAEYVGYELEDDETTTGDPLFVYAIILEKVVEEPVDNEAQVFFAQKYKINIGEAHPPVIARVTDLYKFHRVEGFVSRNTSFMEDSFDGTPPTDGPAQQPYRERFTPPESRSFSYDSRRKSKDDIKYEPTTKSKERGKNYERFANSHENGYQQSSNKGHSTQGSRSGSSYPSGRTNENMPNGFTSDSYHQNGPQYSSSAGFTPEYDQSNYFSSQQNNQGSNFFTNSGYSSFCPGSKSSANQRQRQDSERTQDESDGPREQTPEGTDATDAPEGLSQEDIMNEISDVLEEAWLLPEKERRKVVKRLLLKWHPDKNIDDEVFATTITQYIQSELERLEAGIPRPRNIDPGEFTPGNPFAQSATFQKNYEDAYKFFYEQMNNRAKQHKKQRERYKENFSREYTSTKTEYNFDVPPTFTSSNPQPSAARSFFRQAEQDLASADNDFMSIRPAYEWVCFKAHQAAEKALKAAQFAVDAVSSYSHDLPSLAATTDDVRLRLYAMKLQKIVGEANKLYNPDPIDYVNIPHDRFTQGSASDAVAAANEILNRVRDFMELQ